MSNECYIEIGYYFGIGPIGEIHCDSKNLSLLYLQIVAQNMIQYQ